MSENQKVLRINLHRRVEQKATYETKISEEDYQKLKNGIIKAEQILKREIGEKFGYTEVGWIETDAETPMIDCELGSYTSEKIVNDDL